MSKTIVVAYYPREKWGGDNPIYAIQAIDGDISSFEWLEYIRKESGIPDLKLCHTGWVETWIPRKPKPLDWKDKYQLEVDSE